MSWVNALANSRLFTLSFSWQSNIIISLESYFWLLDKRKATLWFSFSSVSMDTGCRVPVHTDVLKSRVSTGAALLPTALIFTVTSELIFNVCLCFTSLEITDKSICFHHFSHYNPSLHCYSISRSLFPWPQCFILIFPLFIALFPATSQQILFHTMWNTNEQAKSSVTCPLASPPPRVWALLPSAITSAFCMWHGDWLLPDNPIKSTSGSGSSSRDYTPVSSKPTIQPRAAWNNSSSATPYFFFLLPD